MTTDIKLGMVVGLGLVLTVAVTYYSKAVTPPPNGRAGSVMPSLPSARGADVHAAGVAPTFNRERE